MQVRFELINTYIGRRDFDIDGIVMQDLLVIHIRLDE